MTDNLELKKTLWQAADKLSNNIDVAENKHVILGFIFLKYISDAFDKMIPIFEREVGENWKTASYKNELQNICFSEKVFNVVSQARWKWLHGRAKLPTFGKDIDDAMDAIENYNQTLNGVLPKNYARPALDKQKLG